VTKRDLRDFGKDLKLWLGTLMVVVATLLFAALHYIPPAHGAELTNSIGVLAADSAAPREPYSCRLFADAQRQCAFGNCDDRRQQRLRRECVCDGGRP
jgi:hypothetical protein